MNFSIRSMSEKDLTAVAHLDSLAFSEYNQETQLLDPILPRTYDNLQAALDLNPTGCFIAETNEPVGYIFSRIWGKLGWIGVFGVDPEYQKQGVGKSLLFTCIDNLRERSCKIIGLETRSDKIYNVGLYTSSGFRLTYPTLSLTKPTYPTSDSLTYISLEEFGKDRALEKITEISRAVTPDLDYAPEVENAVIYHWGKVHFFGNPEPRAFAIIRSDPKRKSSTNTICEIDALAVRPDYRSCLDRILQSIEKYAHEQNMSQIGLSINASDGEALKKLLDYGFNIKSFSLRMTWTQSHVFPTKGIDLSCWAM